jgi:hypothetical protein
LPNPDASLRSKKTFDATKMGVIFLFYMTNFRRQSTLRQNQQTFPRFPDENMPWIRPMHETMPATRPPRAAGYNRVDGSMPWHDRAQGSHAMNVLKLLDKEFQDKCADCDVGGSRGGMGDFGGKRRLNAETPP